MHGNAECDSRQLCGLNFGPFFAISGQKYTWFSLNYYSLLHCENICNKILKLLALKFYVEGPQNLGQTFFMQTRTHTSHGKFLVKFRLYMHEYEPKYTWYLANFQILISKNDEGHLSQALGPQISDLYL